MTPGREREQPTRPTDAEVASAGLWLRGYVGRVADRMKFRHSACGNHACPPCNALDDLHVALATFDKRTGTAS